ncbi:DUF6629 family protein [Kitasatospora sp. NPDC050543]|uniref:DUF6629 family protein n=1 Tax=Kitasatospora sp. NPDC050543 TaxID=3364054 RepID=UPI00378E9042
MIALPLLPVLVPLGVLCAVRSRAGRARKVAFAVLGVAVAVPLAVAVARHPEVTGDALAYGVGLSFAPLLLAGYLVATIGSLLFSGDSGLRLLGLLVGAAAMVSAVLWRLAFASTWCALAAAVSVLLLRWVGRPRPA